MVDETNQNDLAVPANGDRRGRITEEIRASIVAGEVAPGDRLPTRAELAEQYGVSGVTIQRAFHRLEQDGFVESRGRSGTFVADRPPHLCNYAMAFYTDPSYRHEWPWFLSALVNEANAVEHENPQRVLTYFSVQGHRDDEDYLRLLRDANSRRLAGVIFANSPGCLKGSDLLDKPPVPLVAIMSWPAYENVPAVSTDMESWVHRAMQALAEHGRKRVCAVFPYGMHSIFRLSPDGFQDMLAIKARQFEMELRPQWMQGVPMAAPECVRNAVHAAMQNGGHGQPDGLLVMDDNLVEGVGQGLLAAGRDLSRNMKIVAHANFPWPTPSAIPMMRLGFDVRQILRICVETIEAQRSGREFPQLSLASAIFADQVKSSYPLFVPAQEQESQQ